MIRLVSIGIKTPTTPSATIGDVAPGTIVRIGNELGLVVRDYLNSHNRAITISGRLAFRNRWDTPATVVDEVIGTLQFHVKDE